MEKGIDFTLYIGPHQLKKNRLRILATRFRITVKLLSLSHAFNRDFNNFVTFIALSAA